jgi:hypothetical protein
LAGLVERQAIARLQATEDSIADLRVERFGNECEILRVERQEQANQIVARRNDDEGFANGVGHLHEDLPGMFRRQLLPDGPPLVVRKGLEHERDVRRVHQPQTFVQLDEILPMLQALYEVPSRSLLAVRQSRQDSMLFEEAGDVANRTLQVLLRTDRRHDDPLVFGYISCASLHV